MYLRWTVRSIVYSMLLIAGCTTVNVIDRRILPFIYVDSAFSEHINVYLAEAKRRNKHPGPINRLAMFLGTTRTSEEPHTVGTCLNVGGFPRIVLDEKYWNASDWLGREELVMHELGHCLLNRGHCELSVGNKKKSLMASETLGSDYTEHTRSAFIDELFTPAKECNNE